MTTLSSSMSVDWKKLKVFILSQNETVFMICLDITADDNFFEWIKTEEGRRSSAVWVGWGGLVLIGLISWGYNIFAMEAFVHEYCLEESKSKLNILSPFSSDFEVISFSLIIKINYQTNISVRSKVVIDQCSMFVQVWC